MVMKRTKRVLLLAGLISGAFAAGVYAEDVLQRVEAYLRPDFQLVVNGQPVQLENPTLVYNGKSYLPLTDLGQRLGANIYWKGETKTIYVNTRINTEQREDPAQIYEAMELYNPYSVTMEYLGAQYPVLLSYNNKTQNYGLYYREKDAKRMGIDTSGLAKAKDRLTNETFIHENELQKRWGQPPQQVYSSSGYETYVIGGESNSKKLEDLRDHVKGTLNWKYDNVEFYRKPIFIEKVADKEDTYEYLFYETVRVTINGTNPSMTTTSRYQKGTLKLTKANYLEDSGYTVNMTDKIDLQSEAEKRENSAP